MSDLKVGIENMLEHIAEEKDSAITYGSGAINVFATPAMVAYMEKSAMELVQAFMVYGETTVGTAINIKHIKATPIGMRINTVARLVNINGNKLTFEVEAYDVNGMIGSGIHHRYIVNEIEFVNNLG